MTEMVRDTLFWMLFWIAPMTLTVALCYFFLSLPARRTERARLFLDLLETSVQRGQSPERMIVSVSETRDRSVGVYFHLLAAHIEAGERLDQALKRVPSFLPPPVAAAVKIGVAEGTVAKMLPAARGMLDDVNSRLRGALNHVILFVLVIVPMAIFIFPALSQFVWPKLKQVMADMEINPPAFSELVFSNLALASAIEAIVLLTLVFLGFFYIGGPRAARWSKLILGSWPDRFVLALPWRRNRIQRDFSISLAILLDAGITEARAVELAADATANSIMQRRAQLAVRWLKEGFALPEALKVFEGGREFRWRLVNALKSGKGFFAALRGWHESLEARAFQQEQTAAQSITTGIVLVNGFLVGTIVVAVFLYLIAIIDEGVLW